jgi:hypothetical protein
VETALHVSGGTFTHHQERIQLYLQYLVFVTPLLLSAKSLQVLLSLGVSFQFFTFSFFRSSMTYSCHRCLGLPNGLVPIGLQSNSFLVGLAWSIRCICHSHLIRCDLLIRTISAPSVNLSVSMLFRILNVLSILTGPNDFMLHQYVNIHQMSERISHLSTSSELL